jgi:hypothetical protein
MRKDFYKALLIIFFSAFSQMAFGQCPTGITTTITNVSCVLPAISDGKIIMSFNPVTITAFANRVTFRVYQCDQSLGCSVPTQIQQSVVSVPGTILNSYTFTGLGEGQYFVRYFRTGCIPYAETLPPVTISKPASPIISGSISYELCEFENFTLTGNNPAPSGLPPSIASWTISGGPTGASPSLLGSNTTQLGISNLTGGNDPYLDFPYLVDYTFTRAGCSNVTAEVTLYVNPTPSVTGILSSSICSGNLLSYTATGTDLASGEFFYWERFTIPGISEAYNNGVTGGTPDIFSESSLTNTTLLPVNTFYQITPYGRDFRNCTGVISVLTVTVNPTPIVSFVGSTIYCSNSLTNISLTSNIIGTNYTWTTSVTSGFVNGQSSGSGSFINQTLTGSGTVTYIVSPLVGSTSCPGAQLFIPVTVNPLPTITGLSAPAICSGDNTNITWSVNPAVAAAFQWTASYPLGLSGVASGSTSSITTPITNTTANTLTGSFTITPTISGTGCVGPSTTVSQFVYPLPLVTSTTPGTICSGTAFVRALTSNIPVSGFTIIRLANPNVLETAVTATFSGNSINHTLTGTTGNVEVVQYTIIPISSTNCTGLGVTFNVMINPTPSITGFTLTSICSGFATNIVPNTFPATGSVFTWIAAVQSGSAGGFSNQLTTATGPIVQTLNGNGVVRYSVTPNLNGCIGPVNTADQLINPSPTFTGVAIPASICLGASSTLSVTGTLNYSWSPSGTLSAATGNPVVATPIAFGVNMYNVTGLNTITGCQFSTSVSVTVVNPTTPGIIFSGNNQIFCSGSTIPGITVTATSGIIGLYENGALVSSGASPLNQAANTAIGNHAYSANVTLTGCPGPMSAAVNYTVAGVPTISGTNASICGLNPVNLTVSSNAASFIWSSSASTIASATITPVAFGNNLITVTGTSGTCSNSTVITVTAFAIPTVTGNNVTV